MEGSSGGGGAAGWNAGLSGIAPPPFLSKTYDMVDDPSTDAIVSWGPGDNGFVVWNAPEFARDLLPKYFKHNNFSSFVRQLNTYGFRKIDADRWEFASEGFSKGQKHSLKRIDRRKPYHAPSQPQRPQRQSASVAACVEVGKFSLEEETERLKRGKNVLTQELGRLRQHQQTTDLQLQTLGQRLQGMEQRQQQMMSFLANAMQSPGFLAQLVQQNDGNRCIAISNKKRRLPNQEVDSYGKITSPDGLIIKYQPLLHEAARAMLMQIMKMDSSPRLSNSDGLLLENFPPLPETMDVRRSQDLGVTLAEVPPNTVNCSSSAVSEIQLSSVADKIAAAGLPDIYALSSVPEVIAPSEIGTSVPQFPQIQEVVPAGNAVDISSEYYVVPEVESLYTDPVSARMSASVPNETKDLLYDEGEKLPGIVDPFWEQFLLMASGDTEEEIDDSSIEEEEEMDAGVSGWNSALNMDHLMEQMGLLTSDTNG